MYCMNCRNRFWTLYTRDRSRYAYMRWIICIAWLFLVKKNICSTEIVILILNDDPNLVLRVLVLLIHVWGLSRLRFYGFSEIGFFCIPTGRYIHMFWKGVQVYQRLNSVFYSGIKYALNKWLGIEQGFPVCFQVYHQV